MRLALLFPALAASISLVPDGGHPADAAGRAAPERVGKDVPRPARLAQYEADRAPDGLFYIRAAVPRGSIDFAVDTGANVVVLTAADARRLGLDRNAQDVRAQTAGGSTVMRRVHIDRLTIGGRDLEHVEAAIAGPGMTVSLLGQSALSRFEAVTFGRDKVRFE